MRAATDRIVQPAGVGNGGAQPLSPARLQAGLALVAQHAPAFRLKIGEDGRIRASLFRCEIGSHFQPVVEAARNSCVFGHQTRLSASENRPKPLTVNEITDIARSCDVLAQLHWLDVALHAANYFGNAPAGYSLFVSPAAELFADARQLSGRLRALLDSLEVAPQRLVVRLPDKLIVSLKCTGPLLQAVAGQGFGIALGLPKRFDLLRKLEQQ